MCLSKSGCMVNGYTLVYISYSHIEGMLRVQKSSGKSAKVRIKTDTSYTAVPLTTGGSELQPWKEKSLVSHYSCFLPKVLKDIDTENAS